MRARVRKGAAAARVRIYRRRMARRGSGNPNPSRVSPRLPACTAGANFYGPARARPPRNGFHFRFPAARLGWAFCTRRARPSTGCRQPNLPKLHATGQVGPYATNQTRPTMAHPPQSQISPCGCSAVPTRYRSGGGGLTA
jgi:hypothetical protein